MSPVDSYDAMAPFYREIAERRTAYLAAVDRFVIEHAPKHPTALLDIGSGDGVRGMALAKELRIGTVVLADSSREMIARCKLLNPSETWLCQAQDLPKTELRFDLILCLWNVLGHLPDRVSRVKALGAMRDLLTPDGTIFFDVNNRQNARNYGRWRVLGRIVVDAVAPDERRGDETFEWKIGGHAFPAMGHLFTPAEVQRIICDSGMRIVRQVAVDYATGEVSRSRWGGQLVYELGNR